jgi:hypothetical protein
MKRRIPGISAKGSFSIKIFNYISAQKSLLSYFHSPFIDTKYATKLVTIP